MKSEERHQLLTNDLQVVTNKVASNIEQHVGTAVSIVVGLALVFGIGLWWMNSSSTGSATGWTMLSSAQGLEDFGDVADKFKGQPPGQWALLVSSERTLQTAMPLMFTNREIATTDVKKAKEGFETLLGDKSASPSIRERALWGLALCLETTCDGATDKPLKAYERLLSEFPDTMFKTVAEERITALKSKDSAKFYAWFSKENPQPPEARPHDFKDGVNLPAPKGPGETQDAGDNPDDFIPKKDLVKPADPAEKATADPENKDAASTEKPQTDKPVEGDKPAEPEAAKASDKPAEKK